MVGDARLIHLRVTVRLSLPNKQHFFTVVHPCLRHMYNHGRASHPPYDEPYFEVRCNVGNEYVPHHWLYRAPPDVAALRPLFYFFFFPLPPFLPFLPDPPASLRWSASNNGVGSVASTKKCLIRFCSSAGSIT